MMGCSVYANDINPESVKWMTINLKGNQSKKSSKDYHVFNLDGREFLQSIVFPRIEVHQKEVLDDEEKQWCLSENKIVILMNLPELAWTFLDVFPAWLAKHAEDRDRWRIPIHIYCYTFSKADDRDADIRQRLKGILPELSDEQITSRFVRQVAPNKDMMCVRISLFDQQNEHPAKRFKKDPSD